MRVRLKLKFFIPRTKKKSPMPFILSTMKIVCLSTLILSAFSSIDAATPNKEAAKSSVIGEEGLRRLKVGTRNYFDDYEYDDSDGECYLTGAYVYTESDDCECKCGCCHASISIPPPRKGKKAGKVGSKWGGKKGGGRRLRGKKAREYPSEECGCICDCKSCGGKVGKSGKRGKGGKWLGTYFDGYYSDKSGKGHGTYFDSYSSGKSGKGKGDYDDEGDDLGDDLGAAKGKAGSGDKGYKEAYDKKSEGECCGPYAKICEKMEGMSIKGNKKGGRVLETKGNDGCDFICKAPCVKPEVKAVPGGKRRALTSPKGK